MADFPTIKKVDIEKLIPYARNSRTHSAEQVDQIAASIKEFGFLNPIIIDGENGIIAGHGRVMASKKLGVKELPCVDASHLSETQKRAYIIADNKLALNAGWDEEMLRVEFDELQEAGFDLELTGFSMDEIADLQIEELTEGLTDEDAVPELDKIEPVSVRGDVWQLGHSRVMCGDSTMIDDIDKLTSGEKAQLLHADPPYGMGKEGDGVANDNLYNEDLDKFQMDWWSAFRTSLVDNASAYIWGNAPDLWRLWYGYLSKSEGLTLRNQIVWDKKCIPGMKSDMMRSFAVTTEHCLFFMVGEQGFNTNADNYWDGWEPLRAWLDEQRKQSGLTTDQCNKICGKKNMTQSAFTKGGFRLIAKDDYIQLRDATGGAYFKREYDDLKREYDDLKREFYESRAFFDNAHDVMRDVWEFSRVTGDDRHSHATPKPVSMMERVMKSSLPPKGLCLEPFGGSGSTLMGAEKSGRRCYTMELQPFYVDVIINRWQDFTGKEAVHIESGKTYKQLKEEKENDKISE